MSKVAAIFALCIVVAHAGAQDTSAIAGLIGRDLGIAADSISDVSLGSSVSYRYCTTMNIVSLRFLDARRSRLQATLQCSGENIFPFIAFATVASESTLMKPPASEPLVHAGQHSTLIAVRDGYRTSIPVTVLESASVGQRTRLLDPKRKQIHRGVLDASGLWFLEEK